MSDDNPILVAQGKAGGRLLLFQDSLTWFQTAVGEGLKQGGYWRR